jgi:hypothetical protein
MVPAALAVRVQPGGDSPGKLEGQTDDAVAGQADDGQRAAWFELLAHLGAPESAGMWWSVAIEVIRSNEAGGNGQSMKSPSM